MKNQKIFVKDGKLKKAPEGWKFEKISRRMENRKMIQKDGKLLILSEDWNHKIVQKDGNHKNPKIF